MTESALSPCGTCGDPDNEHERCVVSKRTCGHHCNHVLTHDHCDWCGSTWGEGGVETPYQGSFWPEFPWPKPDELSKEPNPHAEVPTAMCGYPKKCPWCPSTFLCAMKVSAEQEIIASRTGAPSVTAPVAAKTPYGATPTTLPEWAEGWAGGTCGCGALTVTVIVQTGEQAVACARSGWAVDVCKPMSCPCQCADPDCPDRPHAKDG